MLPCVSRSPTYTPKFQSLSDADLDALELLAWGINTGMVNIPSGGSITYAEAQAAIAGAACWNQMSPRQRREMIVSKMLDLTGCASEENIRLALRYTHRFLTKDQIASALDYARYTGTFSETCP